jgi:hypothetical protein
MLFLCEKQLYELTGKRRHCAQVRALNSMRIPHRIRPDGKPMVLPSDLKLTNTKETNVSEPDFGLI